MSAVGIFIDVVSRLTGEGAAAVLDELRLADELVVRRDAQDGGEAER